MKALLVVKHTKHFVPIRAGQNLYAKASLTYISLNATEKFGLLYQNIGPL
jgi:hypothetical protein